MHGGFRPRGGRVKVVLLATEGPTTWMVVNALRQVATDLHVIIEEPLPRLQLLRGRLRRCGFWNTLGQLAFMGLIPRLRQTAGRRINEILRLHGLDPTPPGGGVPTRVPSVNSPVTRGLLQTLQPDVVVLNGTRIVSRETLACCPAPILNIHCGITPKYRGVHGGYWALRLGDPERAGVTVHVVDPGIDTGGILYQARIEPTASDQFMTYPYLQYSLGVPLLIKALGDLKGPGLKVMDPGPMPSMLHYHPTLWCYLKGRIRGVR